MYSDGLISNGDECAQFHAPAKWEIRCDLAAAYRLISLFGMDDLISTHLSARLPGAELRFLLNPYGLMFDEITASSLVAVDPERHAIEREDESKINNAGFTIHSAVHINRGDFIHTRSPAWPWPHRGKGCYH